MSELPNEDDNKLPTPTKDTANEDGVESITIEEWMAQEKDLEEQTRAILGAADKDLCSYDEGHVFRQPVYSCATCCDLKNNPAGICLACTYACHEGHELIELYTKRDFRCECGNDKFAGVKCRLIPDKEPEEKNLYNHNFSGRYCFCDAKYPDENDTDEMIQCCFCEDWFHSSHLGVELPVDVAMDDYEMICRGCVAKLPFLALYNKPIPDGIADGDCRLEKLKFAYPDVIGGEAKTQFYTDGFRKQLCRCDQCLFLYTCSDCEFFLSDTDSIQHYAELGLTNTADPNEGKTLEEIELECVKELEKKAENRGVVIDVVHGYNEMKVKLAEYLKRNFEEGKTLTKRGVTEFFEELTAKRRKSQ